MIEPLAIPGLTFKSLAAVMPVGMAAFRLAGNVPVQILKDIMSMCILHKCGGLFADMDIMWLGRVVQLDGPGYLFPGGTPWQEILCVRWPQQCLPQPGNVCHAQGFRPGHIIGQVLDDRWLAHAHAVLNGTKPAVVIW